MPVTGREAAFLALEAYRKRGARPEMVIDRGLDPRERALAANIIRGVLQNQLYLDHMIAYYAGRETGKLSPEVLHILRLSAYQILFLDRVPDHAAVSEGVGLARKYAARASGLVNAVLRRIGESKNSLPEIAADRPEEILSIRYSHPVWMVEELVRAYGLETCEAILRADNTEAPITAQVNVLKTTTDALKASLEGHGVGAAECPFFPDALYLSGTGALEGLYEFQEGLFYVQDMAARLSILAAGLKPGMRVLDLCAAPGGKSFAAALDMEGRGEIRAFDIHEKKAALVEKGARRLGFSLISAAPGDAKSFRPGLEAWADLVIADVPCSGLGVIRKKPEIRYKTPEELERLSEIQLAILKNASHYARPGGTLLYSTCTILQSENEEVVERFLNENREFILEPFELPEPFGKSAGMRTILPHTGSTDGFFICKMRRVK